METLTRDIVNLVDEKIVPQVHELQTYQNEKGEIAENRERAKQLLLQLSEDAGMIYEAVDLQDAASAFKEDVQDWISRGLGETPYFDRLLTAYRPPQDQEATFFLAPVVTPNGPHTKGCFFEAFFAVRDEPAMMKPIEEELPHPENGCQSLKLITGTKGFTEEKCIVFFPENVKTKEKITSQTFAIFYFNKFYQIYHEDTLKRAKAIFENVSFKSANISPESTYEARVLWGYLHDYYHHCGKKPFHKHIHAKMNFFAGILEEIKVDCQSILALSQRQYKDWEEIIEFVLFERLLRYPSQHNATQNFDSGTGFFLFSWLIENGRSIQRGKEKPVSFDLSLCMDDLKKLVAEIEELEEIEDDIEYKKEAERYVRQYLPPGNKGERFSVPPQYFIYDTNNQIDTPYLIFHNER
ncbi:DUF6421 family protein [Bacillus sonorensis]|uniref:DUF6421 family protein n=1 Tax=Bacillus sonorensis TaxID=119858 RepID=UPI00227DF5A4|nr:DUF6421 family protein [Bacillus sonorensis]MCY7858110.1 DUF6421 family protein [Bacillus sonorensis]MCZ0068104.1 DUF6421 family protein [Bacillus sonorensis]MCZ0094499.1 DUF6421 family protein [Bacillus sonorensis]MEC1519459.1 DUF6421 family protein [Bacillus sonorensis]